ncbi:MAG: DUF1501 domain-containing protein [Planctomycetota bacterium]|nr:DUF1501 domain-containing protein [Planctomycetota bacterium]
MNPILEAQRLQTRRAFFGENGLRLGSVALAMLAGGTQVPGQARAAGEERPFPPLPGMPHVPGKAKAFIYLHMNGGPAQMDLWDYKPGLKEFFDKDLPDSVKNNQRITTMTSGQGRFPVAPSKFAFAQHGKCGTWVSELLPHTAKVVDDLAVVKSVFTNAINHDPACTFVMTGSEVPGKPSIGSWLSYGLGSESADLPAFVVFTPSFPKTGNGQALFSRMWASGFLPSKFNGVALRGVGDPVLYVQNPAGVDGTDRRNMLDALGELNRQGFQKFGDPEIQTRIAQYEMAFRMQMSVPDLVDLRGEPQHILDLYGPNATKPGTFANSCLLTRRLVERGVRVVQLLHRGWDQHFTLPVALKNQCEDTDQACAALVTDLKQRGLLDSTVVAWGGEFGRTVYSQGKLTAEDYGRDHHPRNFCMWLAGGGIRGGITYGETDAFSYNITENPVNVNDINATILHCLGIDPDRFTFKFQGLDQRLIGVEGAKPVPGLLSHAGNLG